MGNWGVDGECLLDAVVVLIPSGNPGTQTNEDSTLPTRFSGISRRWPRVVHDMAWNLEVLSCFFLSFFLFFFFFFFALDCFT